MRRAAAFTLLEVLAVVLLTGLVLGIALDFYVDLSRADNRAADHTLGVRRATAILDRMARDFEGAFVVRTPEGEDPNANGYQFVAESEYSSTGADHIKFITRNHHPRTTAAHESDVAAVAYTVRRAEDDTLELLRWSSPRVPETHDPNFPRDEEAGAALLADGIDSFGVTFFDESGAPSTRWDSSQLVESGELPLAVEIEVAMATHDGSAPVPYRRRVWIPVRPLDLERLLTSTEAGAGVDAEGREADEEEGAEGDGGRGSEARADREPELDSVPTVAYCIDTRAARRLVVGPGKEAMLRTLEAHLMDPITAHSSYIRSHGYEGFLRSDCLPFL
jgi:type II secretory pathway component PulJ